MEVDICQDGADETSLGRTDEAFPFGSVQVHVSSFQQFPDQVEKALIGDFLLQECDQHMKIQLVKAGTYVSFDEPVHCRPFSSKFS